MDPYNRIIVANTELDCQMSVLQGKIIAKKSEIDNLRLKLDNESCSIKKLEEGIKESVEREENIKKTIDGFRKSKSMNEALETNLMHQLKITKEENQKNFNLRNGMLKKFSDMSESYASTYRSLSWVKKKESEEIEIKKKIIELAKLKQMYCDYQRNFHLLHKIGKQRMHIAITNFARLMVERQREMNTTETVEANNNKLEREIKELENQKNSLSYNASKRTVTFVERDTFVSPHLPSSSFKQSAHKVLVSIRERLGISDKIFNAAPVKPLLSSRPIQTPSRQSLQEKQRVDIVKETPALNKISAQEEPNEIVIIDQEPCANKSNTGPLEVDKSDKQEPKRQHKMIKIPEDHISSSDVCEDQANKPNLNKNSQNNAIPSKSLQIIPERRQIAPRRVTFKQKSTEDLKAKEHLITKHRKMSNDHNTSPSKPKPVEVAKAQEKVITKHQINSSDHNISPLKHKPAEVAKDSVLSKRLTDESIQKMNASPTKSDDSTPAVEQNIFSPPFNTQMSLSQPNQKPSNMFSSMYEFPPTAPSPGIMTPPFSSSASQPLGQDFSSLFGGSSTSQKISSTSSFFNLF